MAAASDEARFILPLMEKYGIYSDFDLELSFKEKTSLPRKSPILVFYEPPISYAPDLCNNLIGVASDKENDDTISADAIPMIRNAQRNILINYENAGKAIQTAWHPMLPSMISDQCGMSNVIVSDYFEKHPSATVFELRQFIKEVGVQEFKNLPSLPFYYGMQNIPQHEKDNLSNEQLKRNFGMFYKQNVAWYKNFETDDPVQLAEKILKIIKHRIYQHSVICLSGPRATFALFQDDMPQKIYPELNISYSEAAKNNDDYRQFEKFIQKIVDSGFANAEIMQYIWRKVNAEPTNPLKQVGSSSDLSWTDLGKKVKGERQHKLESWAVLHQYNFRSKFKEKQNAVTANHLTARLRKCN